MVDKRTPAKSEAKPDRTDRSVARIATIAAGATIGSAAIAAAVLFATKKREGDAPAPAAKAPAKAPKKRAVPDTD